MESRQARSKEMSETIDNIYNQCMASKESRDVLPPKKLDITLQKREETEPDRIAVTAKAKHAAKQNAPQMMTSIGSLKTIWQDRELPELLERSNCKPFKRYVQSVKHSNSINRQPMGLYRTFHGPKELLKGGYGKQLRNPQLPVNSLRAQIESMSKSLKDLWAKQHSQPTNDEPPTPQLHTPIDKRLPAPGNKSSTLSSSIVGHYPKHVAQLSDNLRQYERVLLSDLTTDIGRNPPNVSSITNYDRYLLRRARSWRAHRRRTRERSEF
jgi:hypothetical protein